MHFLTDFLKNLLPSTNLIQAIENNDKFSFNYLMSLNNSNLNEPGKAGFPPLQLAFIKQLDEFAFILLEHSADPNVMGIDNEKKPVSILQNRVDRKNISQIRLLILYGADSKNLIIKDHSLIPLIEEAKVNYATISALKNQDNIQAYEELAKIWQTISDRENNIALKNLTQIKQIAILIKYKNMKIITQANSTHYYN